jgi:hypothetical protein
MVLKSRMIFPTETWLEIISIARARAHNAPIQSGLVNLLRTCHFLHSIVSSAIYRHVQVVFYELHRRQLNITLGIPKPNRSAILLETLASNSTYRALITSFSIYGMEDRRLADNKMEASIVDAIAALLT